MEPFETDDLKVRAAALVWLFVTAATNTSLQDWKIVLDDIKEALFTALAQRNVCQRAGIVLNKLVTGLDVSRKCCSSLLNCVRHAHKVCFAGVGHRRFEACACCHKADRGTLMHQTRRCEGNICDRLRVT